MLGREKDFVFFYFEAQSGKIEKREPWEQWAPGAQDIHAKQTKLGIDLISMFSFKIAENLADLLQNFVCLAWMS